MVLATPDRPWSLDCRPRGPPPAGTHWIITPAAAEPTVMSAASVN
jgi:hypothetical protein